MNLKIKIGDSVIVRQGVKEPDLGEFEIGGWQGRIVGIDTKSDNDNILITIEWDSRYNENRENYREQKTIP